MYSHGHGDYAHLPTNYTHMYMCIYTLVHGDYAHLPTNYTHMYMCIYTLVHGDYAHLPTNYTHMYMCIYTLVHVVHVPYLLEYKSQLQHLFLLLLSKGASYTPNITSYTPRNILYGNKI